MIGNIVNVNLFLSIFKRSSLCLLKALKQKVCCLQAISIEQSKKIKKMQFWVLSWNKKVFCIMPKHVWVLLLSEIENFGLFSGCFLCESNSCEWRNVLWSSEVWLTLMFTLLFLTFCIRIYMFCGPPLVTLLYNNSTFRVFFAIIGFVNKKMIWLKILYTTTETWQGGLLSFRKPLELIQLWHSNHRE